MSYPAAERPPPPGDRGEALRIAGDRGDAIYRFVRSTLDELEDAAPWDLLYYPPDDDEEFLAICQRLLGRIDALPDRVDELAATLLADETDGAAPQAVEDIRFYFDGILMMTGAELAKLRGWMERADGDDPIPPEAREQALEYTADLKGKYASSIMGAAASLIAEDRWNGVALEPILFPEKADEFERNELLVETLRKVLQSIDELGREVPLPDFADFWSRDRRIDQYALTPFYAFLGMLGKLMKESSRRALYSGDYHQIRKRESQLSTRVNELNTLHNITWGTVPLAPDLEMSDVFRQLEIKASEVAAILDLELLKEIVGEGAVQDLHAAVTVEKEKIRRIADPQKRQSETDRIRGRLPEGHRGLVPLLYEEDLKTFFDLLLGSVMKRASLAVTRNRAPAPAPGPAPAPPARTPRPAVPEGDVLDIDPSLLEPAGPSVPAFDAFAADPADDEGPPLPAASSSDFEFGLPDDFGFDPAPELHAPDLPAPAAARDPDLKEFVQQASDEDRREALAHLQEALREVLSRENSKRRPLELLHRLLEQGKNVPPGMVQSIHPFVRQVSEVLQPRVRRAAMVAGLPAAAADNLQKTCRALERRPEPDEIHSVVAGNVERLLHLLEGLDSTVADLARREGAFSRGG